MRGLLFVIVFFVIVGLLGFMMSKYQTVDTCFNLKSNEEMINCLNNVSKNLNNSDNYSLDLDESNYPIYTEEVNGSE